MNRHRCALGLGVLLFAAVALCFVARVALAAEPWVVPERQAAKKNPIPMSDDSIFSGKNLFARCGSCHGKDGKATGKMARSLIPKPPDFTRPEYWKSQSEGAVFWKIMEGRGSMPGFRDELTDEECWNIVDYIRTFNVDYKAPGPPKVVGKVEIALKVLPDDPRSGKRRVIEAKVTEDGKAVSRELRVGFYVRRTFGEMLLGQKRTQVEGERMGMADVYFPKDLPGDDKSRIVVVARVEFPEAYAGAEAEGRFYGAVPTKGHSEKFPPALWTRHAPASLIAVMLLLVGGVWVTYGFVFVQGFKLWQSGRRKGPARPAENADAPERRPS